MKKGMGQKEQVYLDCRSDKEYTGEQLSREVARGGHIPGAISMDWVNNVTTRDGAKVLKDADALKAQYQKIGVTPDKQVMAYCRTGARSSNTYFVLKLLGYPNVQELRRQHDRVGQTFRICRWKRSSKAGSRTEGRGIRRPHEA